MSTQISLINKLYTLNKLLYTMRTLEPSQLLHSLQETINEIETILSNQTFIFDEIQDGNTPLQMALSYYTEMKTYIKYVSILKLYEKSIIQNLIQTGHSNPGHINRSGNTALLHRPKRKMRQKHIKK